MCVFLGGRKEEWPRQELLAPLGKRGVRGPFCTLGSLSVPGTVLWASALGRFIFFPPQPAKGTLSPPSQWREGLQRPFPMPVPSSRHSLKELNKKIKLHAAVAQRTCLPVSHSLWRLCRQMIQIKEIRITTCHDHSPTPLTPMAAVCKLKENTINLFSFCLPRK